MRVFGSVRMSVVLVLLGSLPVLPSRVGSFWLFPLGSIIGTLSDLGVGFLFLLLFLFSFFCLLQR